MNPDTAVPATAAAFERLLEARASDERRESMARTLRHAPGDRFLGVAMRDVFALAAANLALPLDELERMLDSPIHEMRVAALSVMAKDAARKRTPPERVAAFYELYLRRHDRIDNWDLVDLAAHHVVGRHLAGRPRDVLYELARSPDPWRRRTAIYSTLHFVRAGDLDDAYAIAELLLDDPHDLQQKITGGILREAGKHDPERLRAFLDRHGRVMSRDMLRTAIERLDPAERRRHLAANRVAGEGV